MFWHARSGRQLLFVALATVAAPAPLVAVDVPFAAEVNLAISTLLGQVVAAVDVDGDGDLDLVGHGDENVRWLEQEPLGTFSLWSCYAYPAGSIIYEAAVADVDGDGDLDIVTYRQNDEEDAYVDWLENDGSPSVGAWTKRNIGWWDAGFLVFEHDTDGLALADFDGDGDLDVATGLGEVEGVTSNRDGRIDWWENSGARPPSWTRRTVQDWWDERVPYALTAGDLDSDGDVDLAASIPRCDTGGRGYMYWFTNDGTPGNGAWARHDMDVGICGPAPNALDVGDIDRDGDLDLIAKDYLGPLIIFTNDGTPIGDWPSEWKQHDGHDARLADLNGDGWLDIVLSFFDGWYENQHPGLVLHDLATDAWHAHVAADLDRDGDADLVYGSGGGTIAWAESLTIHRSALLRDERVANGLVDEAFDVASGDLDRDGDSDLVSVAEATDHVYLHRNSGTPGDDNSWSLTTLTSAVDRPRAASLGDLDGDGDLDVVVASYNDNSVSWLENDGSFANWTRRVISAGAGGANDVVVADFDRDGDLDIACAQFLDDEVSWYRNDGGTPPTFSAFFVDSVAYDGPRALAAGDLDGDGDADLAVVSETANRVVWYTNSGTPAAGEWWRHRTDNGESDGPKEIALADLDRDGDLDTLVANYVGDEVLWYENDGTLVGWTARQITTCNGARGLAAGDFDRDGDPDVLVSCYDEDRVKLQASNGGAPPSFASTASNLTGANGARTVLAADLDRDGDLDGVVAQGLDDQVAWYENQGGQFQVSGTTLARNPLYNDQLEPVLRARVVHRGRSGDGSIASSALAVRLEESPGDPLNALQAASLIDSVLVYSDDGDGVWEPGVHDFQIGSASPAGIDANGVVFVDLAVQIATRIGALQGKYYFVVLDLAQPYGLFAGSGRTLRVTLLAGGTPACEGVDADHPEIPLDLEWSADVPTPTVSLIDILFRDGFESGTRGRWSATRG